MASLVGAEPRTLRSYGASGNGQTDDRAAIQRALTESQGAPVDGEGLTYAVRGNIEVTTGVDLRSATLRQVQEPVDVRRFFPSVRGSQTPKVEPAEALRGMKGNLPWLDAKGVATYEEDPILSAAEIAAVKPSIVLRTLMIHGAEGKPVAVKLSKVRVLRGDFPETGGRSDGAGLQISYAEPVELQDIEVTGHGKGAGIHLSYARRVRLERVNIHDIHWALYPGDTMPSAASLKADWGWNNNPIYEFRGNRFARVRIQEQLTGVFVTLCEDVEIADSTIARLGTMIEGKLLPWQADGMTIGRSKNVSIRRCQISDVWEGIDFTGALCEGIHEEQITISDTFSYGFKFAHPKRNGTIVDCTSIRAGMTGFIIGAESENLKFTNCRAIDTGSSGYWTQGEPRPNIAGFRLEGGADSPLPLDITLEDCRAENENFAGAMAYGFVCEATAAKPEHRVQLVRPVASGFKTAPVKGFPRP